MKKLTLFLILLQSVITIAQAPQRMAYQSVVRNAANQIVANQSIGVKISIIEGSLTGTTVYSETHTTTTNTNGLFTLEAGGGTPTMGTFSAINWGNGSHYIKSEIDVTGGTNYLLSGTMELLSVPYALYAERSGSASLINTTTEPSGTNCANGGTKIEVGLDANSNGILDALEINSTMTKYVCNGSNISNSSSNLLFVQGLKDWSLNYTGGTSPETVASFNAVQGNSYFIYSKMAANKGYFTCGCEVNGWLEDSSGNNIPISSIDTFNYQIYDCNRGVGGEKVFYGYFVAPENGIYHLKSSYSVYGYNNYQNQGGNQGNIKVMIYK